MSGNQHFRLDPVERLRSVVEQAEDHASDAWQRMVDAKRAGHDAAARVYEDVAWDWARLVEEAEQKLVRLERQRAWFVRAWVRPVPDEPAWVRRSRARSRSRCSTRSRERRSTRSCARSGDSGDDDGGGEHELVVGRAGRAS